MRRDWTVRLTKLLIVAAPLILAGCDDDEVDVHGILAIIYAVGDVTLKIIEATT